MANDDETQRPMTAEELVANHSKKDLLELAEKLNTPDVKSDNNKDEIAAKIVAHRDGLVVAPGDQADPEPASKEAPGVATELGAPQENPTVDAPAEATTQGAGDAPKQPDGFEFKAAITVSRAPENGQFFVQFSDGRESRGAANVSQVGVIASQFFAEVL